MRAGDTAKEITFFIAVSIMSITILPCLWPKKYPHLKWSLSSPSPVDYSATYGLSGGNVLPDFVKDTPNEVLTKNCSYWAPAAGTTVGDCNAYKELLNTSLSQMEQMQCTHEQLIFDTSVVQTRY